jgi:phenylacetate-CoA ligase
MFDKLQKKAVNVLLFFDLFKLNRKRPTEQDFVRLKKIQEKRLRKLMKKAYEIPFYRERFDRAGVKPEDIRTAEDLVKLPPLTKDELRTWMSQEANNPKYKDWFHDTTSGSSGVPLMLLYSPREKAYTMANWFRVMCIAGYNPFLGKTMSRKSAHSTSAGADTFLQKLGILRRGFLDQYAPGDEMVRQVNEYKPDFLYMNKSELMRLCLYCKENNSKIHQPKFYCPTGEMTDPAARKLFKEILGDGIIDAYGSAETGSCMLKLFDSTEHFIHYDSFAINIYDDNDQLADVGTVVITPLFKTDIPLINYKIGDKAASEMRNGIRYITSLQGRLNDFFRYDTGEVTTFFEITPIIAHCEDIVQIRFIQDSYTHIRVQCVQNQESEKTKEQVEQELDAALNAKFKHHFDIDFEWTNTIPPDSNGKLRMIVCEVDEHGKK